MELAEALPVIQRWYAPGGLTLRVLDEHICDREHPSRECPYPDSAKYAKMDALHDMAPWLKHPLLEAGH